MGRSGFFPTVGGKVPHSGPRSQNSSPGSVPPQLYLQQIGISSLLKDTDQLYQGRSTDVRRYAVLWPKLPIWCFVQRTEKNTNNCFVLFFFFKVACYF